ncbi:MAG TPA: 50S ribosomal protein L6 [Candidatus Acidoferrales bacterium]|nr:50S ribosomal protein L6 [Candidatus Acidoferrales bacterium]
MSRVAKNPVAVPAGVDVVHSGRQLSAKGRNGSLSLSLHPDVTVTYQNNQLHFAPTRPSADKMAGTMRALCQNMIKGVHEGFVQRLQLIGVGYRAQMQGSNLNLSLGFSHPVNYPVPQGISIETPSQTEIVIKGADKQRVGQVAADIRSYRSPEPYKGKGVRYMGEQVVLKETKKK